MSLEVLLAGKTDPGHIRVLMDRNSRQPGYSWNGAHANGSIETFGSYATSLEVLIHL